MVDLLKIQNASTSIAKINSVEITQHLRPYLGASQIGHSCERYLWYSFRWCFLEKISSRLQRLFNRGHREEPAIVETLESAGIRVWGDQTEVVFGFGHCKGHCDGMSIGVIEAPKTVHLNEYKTMSDKYFKEVCKQGVLASKPVYYAQCQLYMKHLKLSRTLFIAVNKNDDSMYIERIKYDKEYATDLEKKAEEIILSEEPPAKRFEPTWYACKWCSANKICHGGESVENNCRTCAACDILPKGKWECNFHGISLATGQQRIGCNRYSKMECLR